MNTQNFWKTVLPAILLITLGLIIYWPGLNGPFVFDDLSNVIAIDELKITSLDFSSLYSAATSREGGSVGRPIAMLSFALNYYFSELDVFPYKLINLLIHVVTAIGIFVLSRLLLTRLGSQIPSSKQLDSSKIQLISIATALIWLSHPLQLTSVLYVAQRMTSMSGLFVIYGLIVYCIGRLLVIEGEKRGIYYLFFGIPFFTLLSIFCKENGALLPGFAILIEVVFYRFKCAAPIEKLFKRAWYTMILAPVAIGLLIAAFNIGDVLGMEAYKHRDFNLWERLMTESRALLFYLKLILLPNIKDMGLYHDDFPISRDLFEPTTLVSLVAVLTSILASIVFIRKYPLACFGILWFFLAHAIESTIIPLELVHEHRNYLALYGIMLILVYSVFSISVNARNSRKLGYIVTAFLLVLTSFSTYARSTYWSTEWKLYVTTVVGHPKSARAHTQMGIILHDNNAFEKATFHFQSASELAHRDPTTIGRLAQHLYIATGSIPENILKELQHRLETYHVSHITLWTLAPILVNTSKNVILHGRLLGMYEDAVLKIENRTGKKQVAVLYRTLARSHRQQGNFVKSIQYYEKAMVDYPVISDYLSGSDIYLKIRDIQNATRLYEIAKTKIEYMDESELNFLKRLDRKLSMATK